MKVVLYLVLLLSAIYIPVSTRAQGEADRPVQFNFSLSFGSENNTGNPGLLFKSGVSLNLTDRVSIAPAISSFQAIPNWSKEPNGKNRTFSSLHGGVDLVYRNKFDLGRNYVNVGGGLGALHYVSFHRSHSFTVFDASGNPLLHTVYEKVESVDLSYHISLEGGTKLSDKVSIGLVLDIFSYQIFGDITTLGLNFTF